MYSFVSNTPTRQGLGPYRSVSFWKFVMVLTSLFLKIKTIVIFNNEYVYCCYIMISVPLYVSNESNESAVRLCAFERVALLQLQPLYIILYSVHITRAIMMRAVEDSTAQISTRKA